MGKFPNIIRSFLPAIGMHRLLDPRSGACRKAVSRSLFALKASNNGRPDQPIANPGHPHHVFVLVHDHCETPLSQHRYRKCRPLICRSYPPHPFVHHPRLPQRPKPPASLAPPQEPRGATPSGQKGKGGQQPQSDRETRMYVIRGKSSIQKAMKPKWPGQTSRQRSSCSCISSQQHQITLEVRPVPMAKARLTLPFPESQGPGPTGRPQRGPPRPNAASA